MVSRNQFVLQIPGNFFQLYVFVHLLFLERKIQSSDAPNSAEQLHHCPVNVIFTLCFSNETKYQNTKQELCSISYIIEIGNYENNLLIRIFKIFFYESGKHSQNIP